MKLFLIESAPGDAFELEDRLVEAGHRVVTCSDDVGSPCVGINEPARCPLSGHVDLAILSRAEHAVPTLNEAGILCARRHRVPVVRVDSRCAQEQLAEPGEIESVVIQATHGVQQGYADRIETALADHDAVVAVERTGDRVAVAVRLGSPADPGSRVVIADRARATVRAYDPFVSVIDVAVTD